MTEQVIRQAAQLFASELAKYATRLDLPSWREPYIELKVEYTREKGPKLSVHFSGPNLSVSHTSVALLMEEVYRRAGFDDKAELSMQHESSSLLSLTHEPTQTSLAGFTDEE